MTASSALAAAPEAPETAAAESVRNTTVTLRGVVNPKAPSTVSWFFEYNTGSSCSGAGSATTPVHGPEEVQARSVEEHLSGLRPGTAYTACLVARNEAEEATPGNAVSFTTTSVKPTIENQSISNAISSEATLSAMIDAEGSPTTYWVQYGTSEAYGAESSHVGMGAPVGAVHEVTQLTGLAVGSTYHFRFVASSALGTAFGADATVTTPVAAGGASDATCPNATLVGFSPVLPDCRAYELVSSATAPGDAYHPSGPSGAGGAETQEAQFYTRMPFRAAASGDALTFVGDAGPQGGNGDIGKGVGNQYLASRSAAGPQGWGVTTLTPPFSEGEQPGQSFNVGYEWFSDSLETGVLHTEAPLLSQPAPDPQAPPECSALYSRGSDGGVHALFSSTVSPGFCGSVRHKGETEESQLFFAGASVEGPSQLFFQTPAPLAAPAEATIGEGANLYDSTAGAVNVVNLLPDGSLAANATFGGPRAYREGLPGLEGAASKDGSRAFFSTVERIPGGGGILAPTALYARENPSRPQSPLTNGKCTVPGDACTLQIDAAEQGAAGPSGSGRFWAASADGSKVFFTDCNRLTTTSTAVASEGCENIREIHKKEPRFSGADLYEYDFSKPIGERLTDLTIQRDPSNLLGADVQGLLGWGTDGSSIWVYLTAGGALTAAGTETRKCEPANGENATEAEIAAEEEGHLPAGIGCNLYVLRFDGTSWSAPRFIAALAAEDDAQPTPHFEVGMIGDWVPGRGSRTSKVSPDGSHLVFESTQQLTGYENSGIAERNNSGSLLPGASNEIFTYNADVNQLSCVSCDPSGAPPHLMREEATGGGYLPWSNNDFLPRWMNAAGTEVFFDSSQPLVAQDTNGVQDVYEWQQEGTGSCTAASPSRFDGGCVFLLSGGQSPDLSYFLDADEAGNNVFISHRGPLGGAGPADDKLHVYDVRVGGGFPGGTLTCTGTGCQGVPPVPPAFATPSSTTFNGLGNFPAAPPVKPKVETRAQKLAKALKACRRNHNRHAGARCERKARARYGPVKRKAGKRPVKGHR